MKRVKEKVMSMPDYFYGQQSEMFSFYRIPKVLFQEEKYKGLSVESKLLYGLMLARMDLLRELFLQLTEDFRIIGKQLFLPVRMRFKSL